MASNPQGAPPPAAQENPKCPVCGGPMRSNAAKIADGKKMPLWTCQGSKYDSATKQELGCGGVIWPPKESGNTALAVQDVAALQYIEPGLRDFASKLKLLLPNGSKLSDAEALAGAQYAKTTGLDPFRGEFYIVSGIGVVPGYKGALARDGMHGRAPDYRYRPLTDEEKEWHDIQPGDKACICYATDPAEAVVARREGRQPRTWEGVGIVRKADQHISYEWKTNQSGSKYKAKLPEAEWKGRADPPQGRSWGWVAQKTALKDCNNHMGIPVEMDAEQIIASAQAAGIPVVVPEGAWLDSEQAGALVAEAVQAHVRQVDPPNVVKREAEHDYMREGFPDGEQDAAEPDLAPAEWPAALVAIEPYRVRLCANICHVTPATARQRNWMVGALTLLDPDEANQSDLLEWAFGIPTLDLLTAGMGEGLVEWLAPTKDTKGDMQIDPAAQQQYAEIKAALDAWAQEHAQPTLLNA